MNARALIIDDEIDILDLLEMTLEQMGIRCTKAKNLTDAKHQLAAGDFDLCVTDMRLPDGSGIDLVRYAAATKPNLPIAVITAYGSMEAAVEAMKAGAFDFVSKPVKLSHLRRLVEAALQLTRQNDKTLAARDVGKDALLGSSDDMARVRQLIAKLSRSQAPVFITGESGTGKELAARLIHDQGPRAARRFVAVNCGAIPHELMESELFGHRKGSFTGALSDKEGLFHAADGGTLFLDEIADLPLTLQVKLLRAIQEKAIRPVGSQHEIPVDVRIVSASHRPLRQLVETGAFREDLFYRVNVIELHMPPLRQRPEDIAIIASHLLARLSGGRDGTRLKLERSALDALMGYPFPGNVRELENILHRAVALCEGDTLREEDLLLPRATSGTAPSSAGVSEVPLESHLEEIERRAILEALEETHWNRTAAARKLGMTLRSLRYRLSKFGLD